MELKDATEMDENENDQPTYIWVQKHPESEKMMHQASHSK